MAEPGEAGPPPAAPPTGLDWRHLASAASTNDLPAVTRLLAAGIEVDPEDGTGVTALHWACFHGNQQMTAQLLEAGAKVNAALASGRTPLHPAVLGQHSSIVDLLLQHGADANHISSPDGTPLAWAVSSGQGDLVSKLLAAGADPNVSGSHPTTPTLLRLAISLGHTTIAEQLLEAGAVAHDRDANQRTVLHLAAERGDMRLFELLVAAGAEIDGRDRSGASPLHAAMQQGHNQAATQLIAMGADCNVPGPHDKCGLHLAAESGSAQLVAALLAAGADPSKLDLRSSMPLHLAAAAGHAAVVNRLLAAPGVDVNMAAPGSQYTALHAAARAGQAGVAQQLIAAGASIDLMNRDRRLTPLVEAVEIRDLSTVRVLLAAGANPNVAVPDSPMLHKVMGEGAPDELIQLLVRGGADIDAMNMYGQTALLVAVWQRRCAAVQLLLRLGASTSIGSGVWGTPLHLAVEKGSHFIVQQLAAAGANLDALSSSERFTTPCTALYVAVVQGDKEMVSLLLDAGADASQGTSKGHTPLHAALQRGRTKRAELLVAAGADVNAVSEEAGTALAVALEYGDETMVAFLLVAGADPTLGSTKVKAPLVAAVRSNCVGVVQTLLAAPAIQAVKHLTCTALPAVTQPNQAPGGASAAAKPDAGAAAAAAAAAAVAGALSAGNQIGDTSAGGYPLALSRALCLPPDQLDAVSTIATRARAKHDPNSSSSSSTEQSSSTIHERMGAALVVAVGARDMPMVGLLLEAGACPNTLDDSSRAPLHVAVRLPDAGLVTQLLEGGADVNLVSSMHGTPLGMAVAALNSTLVGLLLDAGALPDQHCHWGNTPLIVAAGLQEVAIAQQLLDAGAAVNRVAENGLAPVHTAVAAHNKQMVELLLARGAAINISCKQYGTPIQAAVHAALQSGGSQEAIEVVQALLAVGADPSAAHHGSTTGFSLLHAAAAGRSLQLVQLLVSFDAELEASSSEGTPLQVAVASNAGEVVWVLLAKGAKPNTSTLVTHTPRFSVHVSPLEQALDKGYHSVAEALLAWGADPNASHSSGCGTLLHAAVAATDMAAVKLLLAAAASPNATCFLGTTPLLVAMRQRSADIAEQLLAAGAQPNVVCNLTGCTPLHVAVLCEQLRLALKLLAAGADPSLGQGTYSGTLLQLAVGQGHVLVTALLAAGAKPGATAGSNQSTPLQLAVQKQCCQEVVALLAKGADASVVDSSSGDTLLHTAVRGRSSHLVGLLVGSSADVNATNLSGDMPLLMEARRMTECNWVIIQRLLQHPGINCNVKDASGCSALHYAVRSSSNTGVGLLLSSGANPSVRDSKGRMPLHLAAINGDVKSAQALVQGGADVSATAGSVGWTPLMLATAAGYHDVVKCLLTGGAAASVSAAVADGTSALHLACSKPGTEQLVTALLRAGAAPGAADSSGNTPLHLAAAAGAEDTVIRLLAAGASASFLNNSRELPLHLAIASGHTAAALQLIAAAAGTSDEESVNAVCADGAAPIHLAAVRDSSILTGLLWCKALQVDLVDNAGQTALHKAAAGGHISNLRQLVQHGACLGTADLTGATPLHLAAAGGLSYTIRCLVTSGADKDTVDAAGATPLHRLPLAADPQLVSLLATPGNINRVVGGTTLLHTAAAGGSAEWVAAVLATGAAAGTLDSQGECALVTAVHKGSAAMQLLLLRHMLWQHKLEPEGAALPEGVVSAVQVALAGRANEVCKSMLALVMEVLGEDAASSLWQQLLEQHHNSLQLQQRIPQKHQQQQRSQSREREQQHQLKDGVQVVLVQGFLEACASLAQQQASTTKPLDQAVSRFHWATSQASSLRGGRQQAVGGSDAVATSTEAPAQHNSKFVTLEHTTAAAAAGKLQEVRRLLQQLPADTHTAALGAAAQAAAGAVHYELCGQVLHQLANIDKQEASKVVEKLGLKTEGGSQQPVKVLGPRSLGLCGALLAGWQAVRRQKQQELVDSVVTAAVAWKEVHLRQQMMEPAAGRKRLCPLKRRRRARVVSDSSDSDPEYRPYR